MTDEEIRLSNFSEYKNPDDLQVNVVRLGNIYSFACAYYRQNKTNILDAPLENLGMKDKTLLWSFSEISNLIISRKMKIEQYLCLKKATQIYKIHSLC